MKIKIKIILGKNFYLDKKFFKKIYFQIIKQLNIWRMKTKINKFKIKTNKIKISKFKIQINKINRYKAN